MVVDIEPNVRLVAVVKVFGADSDELVRSWMKKW